MPEQAQELTVTNIAQPITVVIEAVREVEQAGSAVVTPVGTATVEIIPAAE